MKTCGHDSAGLSGRHSITGRVCDPSGIPSGNVEGLQSSVCQENHHRCLDGQTHECDCVDEYSLPSSNIVEHNSTSCWSNETKLMFAKDVTLVLLDALWLPTPRCCFLSAIGETCSCIPMKSHIGGQTETKCLHRSGGKSSGRSRSSINCQNLGLHPSKRREGKAGKPQREKSMLKSDKEDKNIFQPADDKSSETLQSQTSQAIFFTGTV